MSKQLSERLNFLKDQLFNSFFKRKIWWGDDLSILTPAKRAWKNSL